MAEQRSPEGTGAPGADGSLGATPDTRPQAAPESGPRIQEGQGELRPVWPAPPAPERVMGRRWALAARIAATAGGLLFFIAAWTPWATALTSGPLCHPTGSLCLFGLTAAEIGAPPISGFTGDPGAAFIYWSLLTTLGALLAPLLWQRTHPWLMWLAAIAYAGWAALSAATLLIFSQALFQMVPALSHAANGPYSVAIQPVNTRVSLLSAAPAFGIYLAALALLGALAALVLAVIALFSAPPILRRAQTVHGEVAHPDEALASSVSSGSNDSSKTRAARRSIPGAGAVTGGLLLWAWGFWLLPWATLNCDSSNPPLLSGQCVGLPVASALEAGMFKSAAYFDPTAAPWAVSGLLLIGAAMTLTAVWLREITRTLCVWLSAWLIFAVACALIAINGAQLVVHGQAGPNIPTGDWRGSLGTLIVFIGLLIIFTGLAPLWASAIRTAPRRDPASA